LAASATKETIRALAKIVAEICIIASPLQLIGKEDGGDSPIIPAVGPGDPFQNLSK